MEFLEQVLSFLARLHLHQGTVQVRASLADGHSLNADVVMSGRETRLVVDHTGLGRFVFLPSRTIWEQVGGLRVSEAAAENEVALSLLRGGLLPDLSWLTRALSSLTARDADLAAALDALQRIENQNTVFLLPGLSWFNAKAGPVDFPALSIPRMSGYLAVRSVGLDLSGGNLSLQLVVLNATGEGELKLGLGGVSQLSFEDPQFDLEVEVIVSLSGRAASLHLRHANIAAVAGRARLSVDGSPAPFEIAIADMSAQVAALSARFKDGVTTVRGGPVNLNVSAATLSPQVLLNGGVRIVKQLELRDLSASLHSDVAEDKQVLYAQYDAPVIQAPDAAIDIDLPSFGVIGLTGTLALRHGDVAPAHSGVSVETTGVSAAEVRVSTGGLDLALGATAIALSGSLRQQNQSTALDLRSAHLVCETPYGTKLSAAGFIAEGFAASVSIDGLLVENGVVQSGRLAGGLFHPRVDSSFLVTIPPDSLSVPPRSAQPHARLKLPDDKPARAKRLDMEVRLGAAGVLEDFAADLTSVTAVVEQLEFQIDGGAVTSFKAPDGPVIVADLERLRFSSQRGVVTDVGLAVCASTLTSPETVKLAFDDFSLQIDVEDLKASGFTASPSEWTLAGALKAPAAKMIIGQREIPISDATLRVLTHLYAPCPNPAVRQQLNVEFDVTAVLGPKLIAAEDLTFLLPLDGDLILLALREIVKGGGRFADAVLDKLTNLRGPHVDIELYASFTVGYRFAFVSGNTREIRFAAAAFVKSVNFNLKAFVTDGIPFVDIVRVKVFDESTGAIDLDIELGADVIVSYQVDLAAQRFRVEGINILDQQVRIVGLPKPFQSNYFLLLIVTELIELALASQMRDVGLDLPSELNFRRIRVDFEPHRKDIVLKAELEAEKIVWGT